MHNTVWKFSKTSGLIQMYMYSSTDNWLEKLQISLYRGDEKLNRLSQERRLYPLTVSIPRSPSNGLHVNWKVCLVSYFSQTTISTTFIYLHFGPSLMTQLCPSTTIYLPPFGKHYSLLFSTLDQKYQCLDKSGCKFCKILLAQHPCIVLFFWKISSFRGH